MKILITGGAGFIGSHLADYHLAKGDEVQVIDDLSTGSIGNMDLAMKNSKFGFVEKSIVALSSEPKLIKWADRVYHMASEVGMFRVMKNPLKVIETNVFGTDCVLNCLEPHQEIVVASSSEVYELKNKSLWFNHIRYNYALSKLMSEALALSYAKERGIGVAIARIFNTIGLRQKGFYGMVVPRFVQQALLQQPITVYGDGSQRRCFCDVENTVKFLDILGSVSENESKTFDIGGDLSISILDLAYLVKRRAKSNSVIKFVSYEEAYPGGYYEDVQDRVPNLNALNALLEFRDPDIENDIGKTLDKIIDEKRKSLEEDRRK